MKKVGYCKKCDFEFEYEINNMSDITNILCIKCGDRINGNDKKVYIESKFVKNVDNLAYKIINFYYYFYFIFSVIGLLGYYFNYNKILIISSTIMLIGYFIELLFGFTRNIFGLFGLIVSCLLGFSFIDKSMIGIFVFVSYMFLVSNIIKILFNFILNKLYKKYG